MLPRLFTTLHGGLIDFAHLEVKAEHIASLLHALTLVNRFNGHTRIPFSVGKHVLGMIEFAQATGAVDDVQRWILVHDLHEGLTGDVVSPLKAMLQPQIGMLEDQIDAAVWSILGLHGGNCDRVNGKPYDVIAFEQESNALRGAAYPENATYRAIIKGLNMLPPEQVLVRLQGEVMRLLPWYELRAA